MLRTHHCLLCGDPLPAGSRIDRQYCRDSCRTLASRVRKGTRRTPAVSGQTLLQHISPAGTVEQRPLSPLLALAVQHEAQEAELRAELAEARTRLEKLQRETAAEKQRTLAAQAQAVLDSRDRAEREVAELRQLLGDKTRTADELTAENQALRQELEAARQQLLAAQEQAASAQRPRQETAQLRPMVQTSKTHQEPVRALLGEAEIQALVERVLHGIESQMVAQRLNPPEQIRAFFVENRALLSFLSLKVARSIVEVEGTAGAAPFDPDHILSQIAQELSRQAPADVAARLFRDLEGILRSVADATAGAVRRAMCPPD